MSDVKVISRRTKYSDCPVFNVEELLLKKGDEESSPIFKRELVTYANSVIIFGIEKSTNKVLMTKEYRTGAGMETLGLPAGRIEEGEDPLFTATRELEEETGYKILKGDEASKAFRTPIIRGPFLVSPGYSTENTYLVICEVEKLENRILYPEDDEYIEIVPTSIEELRVLILTDELVSLKALTAFLFFNNYSTKGSRI